MIAGVWGKHRGNPWRFGSGTNSLRHFFCRCLLHIMLLGCAPLDKSEASYVSAFRVAAVIDTRMVKAPQYAHQIVCRMSCRYQSTAFEQEEEDKQWEFMEVLLRF